MFSKQHPTAGRNTQLSSNPQKKSFNNWIDLLKRALLQDGILNSFPTDIRPMYTDNDYAEDGGRTWMNANVPFMVY